MFLEIPYSKTACCKISLVLLWWQWVNEKKSEALVSHRICDCGAFCSLPCTGQHLFKSFLRFNVQEAVMKYVTAWLIRTSETWFGLFRLQKINNWGEKCFFWNIGARIYLYVERKQKAPRPSYWSALSLMFPDVLWIYPAAKANHLSDIWRTEACV